MRLTAILSTDKSALSGLTEDAIRSRLERAGFTVVRLRMEGTRGRPRISNTVRALIGSLKASGHSQRAIAAAAGVSAGTVCNILREG